MAESEAQLEVWFHNRVRLLGGISYKLAPTTAGIPDRLVIFPGAMWLVELKVEHGQLSQIQCVLHDRLRDEFDRPVITLFGRKHMQDWLKDVVCASDPQSNHPDYDY